MFSICKRISQRSSFSRGELEGCVGEFLLELENVLEEGNLVQLCRLGNFRLTSKIDGGSDTIKEFNDSYIKGCRVNFHPSVHLTELCNNIKFTNYNPDKKKDTVEETNP